jgi:ribonuclease HII
LPKLSWEERLKAERECWQNGFQRVAGLDEAGRGPLAGPVVAAAFVIRPDFQIEGINDSKQLTLKQRQKFFPLLTSGEWQFGVGIVEPEEIDRINIYQASRVAMRQALEAVDPRPDFLLVDALVVPGTDIPQHSLIHGDALSVAIAAASVIAKHTRDQLMEEYDSLYPGYGFAKHKGYPTSEHYAALRRLGPSPIHRRSFNLGNPSTETMELFTDDEN